METTPAAINLDVEVASTQPLSGRVRSDAAAWQPFFGWLGLLHELDQLVGGTSQRDKTEKEPS
jgi:hypothetical protein